MIHYLQLLKARYSSRIKTVRNFLAGQGTIQAITILNGILLIRWLSVEQQAKFSFAFSIQSSLAILVDLGFTSSIIALVGQRSDDKNVLGKYIQAAKKVRNIFFGVSITIGLILAVPLAKKQNWDATTATGLLIPVILTLFWQGNSGYYAAPLQINKALSKFYFPQIVTTSLRLVLNSLLYFGGLLDAVIILWLNAFAIWYQGIKYKQAARSMVDEVNVSKKSINEALKEMFKYLFPTIPIMVFNAFYGQIAIFFASFFGKSTSIAEVAALGRFNQIFVLLSMFNAVVLIPLIAKSTDKDSLKKSSIIIVVSLVIAGSLYTSALIYPHLFLWVIGEKYFQLRKELQISILVGCIWYLAGIFWAINTAKKFIYWWGTFAYIVGLTALQIYFIKFYNLLSTANVLYSSLFSTFFVLTINILTTIYSFIKMYYRGQLSEKQEM